MKKLSFLFATMLAALSFTACTEENGNEPGSDSKPAVTIYSYNASGENDDPDADCDVRIATNSKATEVYYLAEKTADADTHIKEMGEAGYADYVKQNGTAVATNGAGTTDVTLKKLGGDWTITAVAAGTSVIKQTTFTGIPWNDVTTGSYRFSVANISKLMGGEVKEGVVLQQRADKPTQYRFKDLYGKGSHLIFNKTEGTDKDGATLIRVDAQATVLTFSTYGTVSVRDVATWQGNDNYLDNAIDDNGFVYIWAQYFVAAGNLGYGYDTFDPAE